MVEFSEAMILTDADGDKIAEELLLVRGFCFPLKKNPNKFLPDVKEFCSTRPVGSTAVFKFNPATQRMDEISPKYSNIDSANMKQPQCCPHGTAQPQKFHCAAISIAAGHFDGDGITDHIFLYSRKMDFFFSTDRPKGELPIEKKYVGLTIDLPDSCTEALSIRLVDVNKSGKQDIVIGCSNLGTFLIYSQRKKKHQWYLRENCHGNGSLGDISRFESFSVTEDDLNDACANKDKHMYIDELCQEYKSDELLNPSVQGFTLADINNDGFMDAVVGSRVGYQKFFLYEPSPVTRNHKHISFRLVGDGKDVNRYGIGASLVLYTKDNKTQKTQKQYREISSYQHVTEKYGHQDEKIVFGLGRNYSPIRLVTIWPNGERQTLWLAEFDFTMPLYPMIDVNYSRRNTYFRIRNKAQTEIGGKNLCLSNAGGLSDRSSKVQVVDCDDDDLDGATYFMFNYWGMLESFSEPGLCLIHRDNNSIFLNDCVGLPRSRNNSWHQTQHGFLRWSGSKKVLGLLNGVIGELPFLRTMDMTNEKRQWFLDHGVPPEK